MLDNRRVNEHRRQFKQHKGNPDISLQEILHPDEPFPYLEKLIMAIRKYPYAAIGVMVSIAAIVISAITVVSVSIGGGMFLMYGEMSRNSALLTQMAEKQKAIELQVQDNGNVMRAYEAANGKRIEFVVGLMSEDKQRRMNEYDRVHPSPLMPLAPEERK